MGSSSMMYSKIMPVAFELARSLLVRNPRVLKLLR